MPVILSISIAALLSVGPAAGGPSESISDDALETAVERDLYRAGGLHANAIDVAADQGIVTLTGSVDNILSKERAVRIVQRMKGARAVIDRIEIAHPDRPDDALRRDILRALAADPATESWEISVTVGDGSVTLAGKVDSHAEKELAGRVAGHVRGVRALDNHLKVDYDPIRSDPEVEADIVQRLRWDARIDDNLISVEVENGQVRLTGTVGSSYERSLAVSDAWVAGTRSVDAGDLEIEWWARDRMRRRNARSRVSDEDIRKAVKAAFLHDPRVLSFHPTVRVENGIVPLRGMVDNLKAKKAAAQDARNTVGVWKVNNYLKVRPARPPGDDRIADEVRQAFARDPYVDRYDVRVLVRDGRVHLHGTVDSYFDKEQAGDAASRILGVTDVKNFLTVPYERTYPYLHHDWDPVLYDFPFDSGPDAAKGDWEIKNDIEEQLWWSPFVDADDVNVSVEEGVATLTGTVDTWAEYNAAAKNAYDGGAIQVINKLRAATGPQEISR